jgi:hypothetical protein
MSYAIPKKNIEETNNKCEAARPYSTIGEAYTDLINNKPVYLNNTNGKYIAYKQCDKSCIKKHENTEIKEITDTSDSSTTLQNIPKLCHIHGRMYLNNNNCLKLFAIDIKPRANNDKERKLADKYDSYFDNMGKRGCPKKEKNPNDSISQIQKHKNKKLLELLTIYANKLLSLTLSDKKSKETIDKLISSDNSDNELSDESIDLYKGDEDDEDDEDDEENNASDNENNHNKIDNENKEIKENKEDEEEETISCVPIKTNNGKDLWLDSDSFIVYEQSEDDNGTEIGVLKIIPSIYETIKYEDKSYTVLKDINYPSRGKISCCVITDKLFKENDDESYDYIGIRKKKKSNSNVYNFEFSDEI